MREMRQQEKMEPSYNRRSSMGLSCWLTGSTCSPIASNAVTPSSQRSPSSPKITGAWPPYSPTLYKAPPMSLSIVSPLAKVKRRLLKSFIPSSLRILAGITEYIAPVSATSFILRYLSGASGLCIPTSIVVNPIISFNCSPIDDLSQCFREELKRALSPPSCVSYPGARLTTSSTVSA